jgi:aminotransferase
VVVGTFSKSFGMMGWRVGFLVADASVCAEAVKIQDAMIICAPVISQMAALGAVSEEWDYPASFHEQFLERRDALAAGVRRIPQLHWTPANAAFFGFVRVDGCSDSTALAESLIQEAHVVTLPGAAFGQSGEGHLRLSYGAVSTAAVAEAMLRLATYFERRA